MEKNSFSTFKEQFILKKYWDERHEEIDKLEKMGTKIYKEN